MENRPLRDSNFSNESIDINDSINRSRGGNSSFQTRNTSMMTKNRSSMMTGVSMKKKGCNLCGHCIIDMPLWGTPNNTNYSPFIPKSWKTYCRFDISLKSTFYFSGPNRVHYFQFLTSK